MSLPETSFLASFLSLLPELNQQLSQESGTLLSTLKSGICSELLPSPQSTQDPGSGYQVLSLDVHPGGSSPAAFPPSPCRTSGAGHSDEGFPAAASSGHPGTVRPGPGGVPPLLAECCTCSPRRGAQPFLHCTARRGSGKEAAETRREVRLGLGGRKPLGQFCKPREETMQRKCYPTQFMTSQTSSGQVSKLPVTMQYKVTFFFICLGKLVLSPPKSIRSSPLPKPGICTSSWDKNPAIRWSHCNFLCQSLFYLTAISAFLFLQSHELHFSRRPIPLFAI